MKLGTVGKTKVIKNMFNVISCQFLIYVKPFFTRGTPWGAKSWHISSSVSMDIDVLYEICKIFVHEKRYSHFKWNDRFLITKRNTSTKLTFLTFCYSQYKIYPYLVYVTHDLVFLFHYNTDGVLSGIVLVQHTLLHFGMLSDILTTGVVIKFTYSHSKNINSKPQRMDNKCNVKDLIPFGNTGW